MSEHTTSNTTIGDSNVKISTGIKNKIEVIVRLRVEGFHNWPDAFPEVSFLKDRHRHIFHIECRKEVTHDDRDIEIIMLKRRVIEHLDDIFGTPCEFGSRSCEMIAIELVNDFDFSEVKCLEDGECGAVVYE